jgi:pimeloyl-ACP methyl ester carboxylesterase
MARERLKAVCYLPPSLKEPDEGLAAVLAEFEHTLDMELVEIHATGFDAAAFARLARSLNCFLSGESLAAGYSIEYQFDRSRPILAVRNREASKTPVLDNLSSLLPCIALPPNGLIVPQGFSSLDTAPFLERARLHPVNFDAPSELRRGIAKCLQLPSNEQVALIHGIMTRAVWQKHASTELANAGYTPCPYDYGWFDPMRLVVRPLRDRAVEKFVKWYNHSFYDHGLIPNLVAHSFGTYIAAAAMTKYSTIRFDRIIFCGSIVATDYPWPARFTNGQVREVRNESATGDWVVLLARNLIHDAGPSGRHGFSEEHPHLHEVSFPRKHSNYFDRPHLLESWIPFLSGSPRDR